VLSTKRSLLFASLPLFLCLIAAANASLLILTFTPDHSVELCSYTSFSYETNFDINVAVTDCKADVIFKNGFEPTLAPRDNSGNQ
jgi:hypothetical protein